MIEVTIPELEADFFELIKKVENGEEIGITRDGVMIALIRPVEQDEVPEEKKVLPFGSLRGNRKEVPDSLLFEV